MKFRISTFIEVFCYCWQRSHKTIFFHQITSIQLLEFRKKNFNFIMSSVAVKQLKSFLKCLHWCALFKSMHKCGPSIIPLDRWFDAFIWSIAALMHYMTFDVILVVLCIIPNCTQAEQRKKGGPLHLENYNQSLKLKCALLSKKEANNFGYKAKKNNNKSAREEKTLNLFENSQCALGPNNK